MKRLRIDRGRHLCDEPGTGHNRWHAEIAPLLEVDEGEEVVFETRDAADGYLGPGTTVEDLSEMPGGAVHPLTGPVFIKEARPGDLLEIEFLDIIPETWGFTAILPGRGFLRDVIDTSFLAHWRIEDGWATSPEIPGVRLPGAPFMGISGVAPSAAQLAAWREREAALAARGGAAPPPDGEGAIASSETARREGLRTIPPRENGGNFDVKQLTQGAKLFLPVAVDGALFSTGDAHFAQGDGEVCLMAVEMGATCVVRFRLYRGEAERRRIRWPRFARSDYFCNPRWGMPERFIATMGMPVDDAGVNHGENLNMACRNALLDMIAILEERSFSRQQAYAILSVAADLKINNVVDLPNVVVSAYLPEEIFQS